MTQAATMIEQVARAIEKPFLPHGYELKPYLLRAAAKAAIAALQGSAALPSEAIETALSQIDEAERAMIEERKTQYGSAFKNEQLSAIQHLHRQQRAGVKAVERAMRAATPTAPVPEGCSCTSYPHTCHLEARYYDQQATAPVQGDDAEYARHTKILRAWGTPTSEWAADTLDELRSRLSPTPDTGLIEAHRDDVIAAYKQGALDVHNNWQEDRDPDFTEAAHDYADTALANAAPAQVESGKCAALEAENARLKLEIAAIMRGELFAPDLTGGETVSALTSVTGKTRKFDPEAASKPNQATKGDGL